VSDDAGFTAMRRRRIHAEAEPTGLGQAGKTAYGRVHLLKEGVSA
jgi:hypothetical protein